MSFSVGTNSPKADVVADLHEKFAESNPNVTPAASAFFEQAAEFVDSFLAPLTDDGYFSVSISGHASEGDGARDYISVSINPSTDPEPPVNENVGAVQTEPAPQPTETRVTGSEPDTVA